MQFIKGLALGSACYLACQYLMWPVGLASPPVYTVWTVLTVLLYGAVALAFVRFARRFRPPRRARSVWLFVAVVLARALTISLTTDLGRGTAEFFVPFVLELARGAVSIGLPVLALHFSGFGIGDNEK